MSPTKSSAVIVETANGKLRGADLVAAQVFKGIPYGGSLGGQARFKPPVKVAAWTGVKDALEYGTRSLQAEDTMGLPPELLKLIDRGKLPDVGENCLVLNVWTPSVTDNKKRPVMVWLHGGAFFAGSNACPWEDGTNLASGGDVVVVSVNHRLGAMGYLHLGDLGGEQFAQSGIAGMLDIVLALEWVRDNIRVFNGDPSNVTLFGQSGGGAKISVLMAMQQAKGLFHKAIIQSGPDLVTMNREEGTAVARDFLAEIGVGHNQLEKIYDVPADVILKAQYKIMGKIRPIDFAKRRRQGFNPIQGLAGFESGPFDPEAPALSANIPILIGSTKDELNVMAIAAPWTQNLDETLMRERARDMIGKGADEIVDIYRKARPKATPQQLILTIASDYSIRVPSIMAADRKAAQKAPVWHYLFSWDTPVYNSNLGSPHVLDVPFAFDQVDACGLTGNAFERYALARAMSRTWATFAHTGNPNNQYIPNWPTHESNTRPTMVFDVECKIENDPFKAERMAWKPGMI